MAEFGRLIGVDSTTVGRYENGLRIPHPTVMARIFAKTEGAVGPADFYNLSPVVNGGPEQGEAA